MSVGTESQLPVKTHHLSVYNFEKKEIKHCIFVWIFPTASFWSVSLIKSREPLNRDGKEEIGGLILRPVGKVIYNSVTEWNDSGSGWNQREFSWDLVPGSRERLKSHTYSMGLCGGMKIRIIPPWYRVLLITKGVWWRKSDFGQETWLVDPTLVL